MRPAPFRGLLQENRGFAAGSRPDAGRNAAIAHDLLPISAAIAAQRTGQPREQDEWRSNDRQRPARQPRAKQDRARPRPDQPREPTNLDRRYGEIGIVAVAAAVHYAGVGKKPADAPAAPQIDQRFIEVAI